ncbi:MAG: LamG-like jellyroll fold domain-containing protein [Candidatus Woesearchaeota archaeon]
MSIKKEMVVGILVGLMIAFFLSYPAEITGNVIGDNNNYVIQGIFEGNQNVSLASNASWIGERVNDESGYKVEYAGDVNNDGYDDFLILADRYYEEEDYNDEKIYLILGSANGWTNDMNLSNSNASWYGENIDYGFTEMSYAGDVNNDSYDDILLGSEQHEYGGNNAGMVYLILGSATGWENNQNISLAADASWYGETEGSICYKSNNAGDVNNDGYDDIIISAYGAKLDGLDVGKVYLIFGPSNNWHNLMNISEANASWYGEGEGDSLGVHISSAGDVNNDGYSDFIIESGNDYGGPNSGKAYLILGATNGWSNNIEISNSNASWYTETYGESIRGVSSAGDVNNDSYDDMLIIDEGNSLRQISGKLYIIMGSEGNWNNNINLSNSNASWRIEKFEDSAFDSIDGIGDINNDGYDDILVGTSQYNENDLYLGKVYLIYGSADNWNNNLNISNANASWYGGSEEGLGISVSKAGNINSDDYPDILIGANSYESSTGKTYLIYGGPSDSTETPASPTITNQRNYTNDRMSYIFSAQSSQTGTCTLYGNFSSSWSKNETKSITANTLFNFTQFILSNNSNYVWNVNCSNSSSDIGSGSNLTFTTLSPITLTISQQINYSNDGILYIFSAQSSQTGTCTLYGNWSGSWSKNETKSVTSSTKFNFTAITFTNVNNNYFWNINCSDDFGNTGRGSNSTFSILAINNLPALSNLMNYTLNLRQNLTFTASAKLNRTGICTLYGNWSGSWAKNETKEVTANVQFNFTSIVFSFNNLTYLWGINCTDSYGLKISENTTYKYTLNPYPVVTSISIVPSTVLTTTPEVGGVWTYSDQSNYPENASIYQWYIDGIEAWKPHSLVAYWRFDNSPQEVINNRVVQVVGNVNNVTGKIRGGYDFFENGTFVNTTSDSSLDFFTKYYSNGNGTFKDINYTWSAWIYPKGNQTMGILNKGYKDSFFMEGFSVYLKLSDGLKLCIGDRNPPDTEACSTENIPLNSWSLITITFMEATPNGYNNGSLYLNGNELLKYGISGFYTENTASFDIGRGRLHTGGWYYFNGTIDEVKVWNKSLSLAEISDEYNMTLYGQIDRSGANHTIPNLTSSYYSANTNLMFGVTPFNGILYGSQYNSTTKIVTTLTEQNTITSNTDSGSGNTATAQLESTTSSTDNERSVQSITGTYSGSRIYYPDNAPIEYSEGSNIELSYVPTSNSRFTNFTTLFGVKPLESRMYDLSIGYVCAGPDFALLKCTDWDYEKGICRDDKNNWTIVKTIPQGLHYINATFTPEDPGIGIGPIKLNQMVIEESPLEVGIIARLYFERFYELITGQSIKVVTNFITTKGECIEIWDCAYWTRWNENGTRQRTCQDLNKCGTEKNKPIQSETCQFISSEKPVQVQQPVSIYTIAAAFVLLLTTLGMLLKRIYNILKKTKKVKYIKRHTSKHIQKHKVKHHLSKHHKHRK